MAREHNLDVVYSSLAGSESHGYPRQSPVADKITRGNDMACPQQQYPGIRRKTNVLRSRMLIRPHLRVPSRCMSVVRIGPKQPPTVCRPFLSADGVVLTSQRRTWLSRVSIIWPWLILYLLAVPSASSALIFTLVTCFSDRHSNLMEQIGARNYLGYHQSSRLKLGIVSKA
ncbi:hypothetical protein VTN77DRAFT_2022 [Rasamsonia byssochlamydoides]|uniref:uncharacterized protein n=1 Tax=Rasamsonia byssochlamydoides TaxID=89139 RepID=UPI003741F3A9